MSDDMTFCSAECDKTECYRHPSNIQDKTIPHSYADFSGDQCVMKECCRNCKYKMTLERFDYGHGGCQHSIEDGFACIAFIAEGTVVHMVNIDEDVLCECYKRRDTNDY